MVSTQQVIIGVSDLLPGDILLHRSISQKLGQKVISKLTNSPYTHASIYLGDDQIAEATPFKKIRITTLSGSMDSNTCIGVLRTQLGFGADRHAEVREFLDQLIRQKTKYDFSGVIQFTAKRRAYYQDQLRIISENYGKAKSAHEFTKKEYFCSALIVACYCVAGIIGGSAQVAYPTDVHSPADLYREPTFGWFLGYLIPAGQQVPADDPLKSITGWRDNKSAQWWP